MAESMLRAGGRFWTCERFSNQSRISSSMKRQRRRLPSPSGCAGTYPSRAQRMRVLASIRIMAAASVASKILNLRTALRGSIGGSFGEFIGLISETFTKGPCSS